MPRTASAIALALLLVFSTSEGAEITGPTVSVKKDGIFVTTGVTLEEEQVEDIMKGVSKEIVIYIDLFRVWNYWPDEFVLGATFTQTLLCDPVKKEYVATSIGAHTIRERRFRSCERLIAWVMNIEGFKLTGAWELEPSEYFVKVTAESRLRRLPPFINLLFFFVKEKEFSITKDSLSFPLNKPAG